MITFSSGEWKNRLCGGILKDMGDESNREGKGGGRVEKSKQARHQHEAWGEIQTGEKVEHGAGMEKLTRANASQRRWGKTRWVTAEREEKHTRETAGKRMHSYGVLKIKEVPLK